MIIITMLPKALERFFYVVKIAIFWIKNVSYQHVILLTILMHFDSEKDG